MSRRGGPASSFVRLAHPPALARVALVNGSIGYIPTRRAFAEGNYEAVSARCAEGSGEILVAAAIKLMDEVRP